MILIIIVHILLSMDYELTEKESCYHLDIYEILNAYELVGVRRSKCTMSNK